MPDKSKLEQVVRDTLDYYRRLRSDVSRHLSLRDLEVRISVLEELLEDADLEEQAS